MHRVDNPLSCCMNWNEDQGCNLHLVGLAHIRPGLAHVRQQPTLDAQLAPGTAAAGMQCHSLQAVPMAKTVLYNMKIRIVIWTQMISPFGAQTSQHQSLAALKGQIGCELPATCIVCSVHKFAAGHRCHRRCTTLCRYGLWPHYGTALHLSQAQS